MTGSTLRVLVTGSRRAKPEHTATISRVLHATVGEWFIPGIHTKVMVIHGGAYGVDSIAGKVASDSGWWQKVYKIKDADWLGAGPNCNKRMVDAGADVCIGFPIGKSPGTRSCVSLALNAKIETRVHPLDCGDEWLMPSTVIDGKIIRVARLDATGKPVETQGIFETDGIRMHIGVDPPKMPRPGDMWFDTTRETWEELR